jgi:hypothetical protein
MDVVPAPPTAQAAALTGFRQALHATMSSWADALFELTDATLCAGSPVSSVPHLSLEPCFRRSHGSLYKALARGTLDEAALRRVLITHRPTGWPPVFAVDASTWDRCDAETSPERGFYYHASKHSAGQPIVAGWSYQWICQLSWAHDSWTAPIDARRIPVTADVTGTTATQIREVAALLADHGEQQVPLFVFDAGYDPIGLTHELADLDLGLLVRIRDDRVFYTDPPEPEPGTPGRPRRHGARFKCSDADSWPAPDHQLTVADARYGTVTVTSWSGLHPKLGRRGRWTTHHGPTPIVRGTVIRVEVEHLPKPTARANKTLWLWWAGPGTPDLEMCFRAYLRRFDIEHTYRFAKNTLGWTTPRIATPAQADRWTWLIVAAYTQLRLARGLVAANRLPWEKPRQPDQLTPARVRRGFRPLAAHLGTPARPPKSDTPGPGRPKGTPTGPRTRHPAIKKAA